MNKPKHSKAVIPILADSHVTRPLSTNTDSQNHILWIGLIICGVRMREIRIFLQHLQHGSASCICLCVGLGPCIRAGGAYSNFSMSFSTSSSAGLYVFITYSSSSVIVP